MSEVVRKGKRGEWRYKRRENLLGGTARDGETTVSASITGGELFAEEVRWWLGGFESEIRSQESILVKLK